MPYTHHINTKQVMHWIQFQSYQPPINLDQIAGFHMDTSRNFPCIQFTISSGSLLDWEYDDKTDRDEDYQKLIEMVLPIRSN